MSLPPNFFATLSAYEDEQLYEMLADKDDYLPEAVEAARAEFSSRHLPREMESEIQHAVDARIAAQKRVQELPLRGYQKVLLFIGSAGLLSLILIAYFSAKGQAGRVCESWRWMVLGLSFWVLFGLLMGASGSVGLALVLGFAVASGLYYTLLRPSAEDQPPQQAASSSSSRAIAGAGPDCVSCRTPLPAGAGICPHCGWTQPGQSSLHANP